MRFGRLAAWVAAAAVLGVGIRFLDERLLHAVPVAINLALAAGFAWTLRRGSVPMISRFARRERGDLEPDLVVYTRRLTILWSGFFVAMAAIAAGLALAGWIAAWTVFALVGNYALVGAFIVGEYLYRRRRFASLEHAPPAEMWRHACAELRRERSP